MTERPVGSSGKQQGKGALATDDGRLILRWIEPAVQAAQRLLA